MGKSQTVSQVVTHRRTVLVPLWGGLVLLGRYPSFPEDRKCMGYLVQEGRISAYGTEHLEVPKALHEVFLVCVALLRASGWYPVLLQWLTQLHQAPRIYQASVSCPAVKWVPQLLRARRQRFRFRLRYSVSMCICARFCLQTPTHSTRRCRECNS